MNLAELLRNPTSEYRPVPFWSWNDRLEEAELREQIRAMHEVGIGGFFMHARGGLQTPYLGEEWFARTAACIDEADRLGMHPWAYDENGWPSGFGDGRVNGLGLGYQQKYLRQRKIAAGQTADPERLVCLHADGRIVVDADEVAARPVDAPAESYHYDVNPFYVDTLDGEVTRMFLDKIYREYAERLDARAWSRLDGFFTDEPQVSRNGIPWSFTLPEEYRKAYGEELLPRLNELFDEIGEYRRTRHRFWKLVTRLFMDNFMKPIYDWCEAHGRLITGHHVLEETYHSQITSNGAIMPQYQYYHIPGMDWLGRRIRPATTAVQLLSACAQLGKRQILSETFAMCGWDVRFSDLKWIVQDQMVRGVNWVCQHLESYTLRGIRKRDYPASLFRHQPWWDRYRVFNDYISRLGVLLREGDIRADVLVLHGIASAWTHFNDGDHRAIDRLWQDFKRLGERFDAMHVEFHYGDDTLIAQHGSVADKRFVVGRQSYRLVVLPPVDNMARETVDLLGQYLDQGGIVMAMRNRVTSGPILVDGEPCERLDAMAMRFVWFEDADALAQAVGGKVATVPVVAAGTPADEAGRLDRQAPEITMTRRFFDDWDGAPAEAYYFTSSELEKGIDVDIHLPAGQVRRFDPATGECVPVHFRKENGRAVVPHYFAGAGDLVLVRTDDAPAPVARPEYFRIDPVKLEAGAKTVRLDGEYAVEEITSNWLTLDYCDCYFDGVRQFEDGYVLDIQDMACELRRPVDIRLDFRFDMAKGFTPAGELFLVMEIPEKFAVSVNGRAVPMPDLGFLFDPAFRKVAIGDFVRPGENVITLSTRFEQSQAVYDLLDTVKAFEAQKNKLSYDMEIEAIYLAGAFAVRPEGATERLPREAVRFGKQRFTLSPPPESVELKDLTTQGLPFFSGRATVSTELTLDAADADKPAYLVWNRQKAVTVVVRVNGTELPVTIWPPYILPVDGLREGENTVEIELTGSLRNLLGPHHLAEGESYGTSPATFYRQPGVFASWPKSDNDEYPHWNDGYCVKEFGIEGLRLVIPKQ